MSQSRVDPTHEALAALREGGTQYKGLHKHESLILMVVNERPQL